MMSLGLRLRKCGWLAAAVATTYGAPGLGQTAPVEQPPVDGNPSSPNATSDADIKTSSLSWVRLDGAESCIAASALAKAVEERLARTVFVSTSDADLNIEGSIGPGDAGGFVSTVRVAARNGEVLGRRDVSTDKEDCSDLDVKVALIISIMIDPTAALAPPPPSPPPPSPPPPPPPPTVVPGPPQIIDRVIVVPERRRPPRIQWEVGAGVMSSLGAQPLAAIGFSPTLLMEFRDGIALLADGAIAAASTADGDAAGQGASISFVHGALGICPVPFHPRPVSVYLCGGWSLGAALSDGLGFDVNRSGAAVVTGPWLDIRLVLRIVGPLSVATSISAVVPVTRAEIYYRNVSDERDLFETSPVMGHASVGLSVKLP